MTFVGCAAVELGIEHSRNALPMVFPGMKMDRSCTLSQLPSRYSHSSAGATGPGPLHSTADSSGRNRHRQCPPVESDSGTRPSLSGGGDLPLPAPVVRPPFDHSPARRLPRLGLHPAHSALLSLLLLKLLDKERRSHVNDFNFDPALGLFAGLNILPKKSFSDRVFLPHGPAQQQALLAGWVSALAPLLFPEGHAFSLDFHPIPYRGDDTGLENHHIPWRVRRPPAC